MSDEIVVGNVVTIALGYVLGRILIALAKFIWGVLSRATS